MKISSALWPALLITIVSLGILPASHAATPTGNFVKLFKAEQKLRETMAHLYTEALNSGKSPDEIAECIAHTKCAPSKKENTPNHIFAVQNGAAVDFHDQNSDHELFIQRAYPDLKFILDGKSWVFHMTNQTALKKDLATWNAQWAKRADAGGRSPFSLFIEEEAHAQLGIGLLGGVAGYILGRATSSSSNYYYNNTNVVSEQDPEIAGQLREINQTLTRIERTQAAIAQIQIPSMELDIAKKLQGDASHLDDEAKDQAINHLTNVYGEAYRNLLVDLRAKLNDQNAHVNVCAARTPNAGLFMEFSSNKDNVAFSSQRKAVSTNNDQQETHVGDLTIKETLEPQDPVSPISPANQQIAASYSICLKGNCKTYSRDDGAVEDAIYAEISRKSLTGGKLDLAPLMKIQENVTAESKKNAADPSCAAHQKDNAFTIPNADQSAHKTMRDLCTQTGADEVMASALNQFKGDGWLSHWYNSKNPDSCYDAVYQYIDKLTPEQLAASVAKINNIEPLVAKCEEIQENAKSYDLVLRQITDAINHANEYNQSLTSVDGKGSNKAAEAFKSSLFEIYQNVGEESGNIARSYLDQLKLVSKTQVDIAAEATASDEQSLCCRSAFCRTKLASIKEDVTKEKGSAQ
jgi:hypothetical protein